MRVTTHRLLSPRRRAALIAGVVAAAAMAPALPVLASSPAPESALHFVDFVRLSDLSCGKDCTVPTGVRTVGSDPTYGVVLLSRPTATLMTVDTHDLQQKQTIPLGTFPGITAIVDPKAHVTFLGTATQYAGAVCQNAPLACTAGPTVVHTAIKTVHLDTGRSEVYTFPSAADGMNVIAMTPMHRPDGKAVLLALLYADRGGVPGVGGVGSDLTLYALDPSAMDDTKPESASAVLWNQPIPMCATTPSWSVAPGGGQPEFLGADPAGRFAYFACRGLSGPAQSTMQPAGAIVVDFGDSAFPMTAPADGFQVDFYPNGANTAQAISAGDAGRGLLFIAIVGTIDKLYVFDAAHRAWVGSVPFPVTNGNSNLWSVPVDPSNGRAYVIYVHDFTFGIQADQLPVPQGAPLSFGDLVTAGVSASVVDPGTHRMFIPSTGPFQHADGTNYPADDAIAVFQDMRPPPEPATPADPDSLTHDVDVTPQTPVSFAGYASAFGAQLTVVGGERSTPIGQSTPGGGTPAGAVDVACFVVRSAVPEAPCANVPNTSDGNRTVTFGQVVQTEVSDAAATSDATPLAIDGGTTADQSALADYNAVNSAWGQGTNDGSDPPATAPTAAEVTASVPGNPASEQLHQEQAPVACADYGSKPANPTSPRALAMCDRSREQAAAAAGSPAALSLPNVTVADAQSGTVVGRTPANEVKTLAVADARGIRIAIPTGGEIAIGEVRTRATSVAAGRPGTSTSLFERSISNVVVTDATGATAFRCGFDGSSCDIKQLNERIAAEFATPVRLETPSPDLTTTVKASPGGAQAEIIKSKHQFWNDLFTNGDAGVEVVGLRVVFVGDTYQPSRLVLNLAGVHVESHDAIGLTPPTPPDAVAPSLRLELTDDSTPPAPLAGASFVLTGPDGAAPIACLTGADGIGTCSFPALPPGTYTIQEKSAPPGYAPVDDYQLLLEPGNEYKTTFVNLPAIGSVEVTLTSPAVGGAVGGPLKGGVFALVKGKAVLDTPLATCTTDAAGACGFTAVPLGDYTMQQVTAPDDFVASDAVEFRLTKPREVARLAFVDGIPGVAAVPPVVIPGKPAVPPTIIPGKPAVPPKVIPGKPAVPPRTMVLPALDGTAGLDMEPVGYETDGNAPVVASSPSDGAFDLGAGGLSAIPARLARLLVHSPQQAVLLLFMWLVLGLPVYLWVRRRQFLTATEGI